MVDLKKLDKLLKDTINKENTESVRKWYEERKRNTSLCSLVSSNSKMKIDKIEFENSSFSSLCNSKWLLLDILHFPQAA